MQYLFFKQALVPELKRQYSISEKNTKILIVPGNHDIDWGGKPRLDSTAIRAFADTEKEKHLQHEITCMKCYFSFSNRNKCFFSSPVEFGQLITRKILHFDNGYRIEANLINTAPFSCNSDDGLHYLPEDAIQSLTKASKADIAIVLLLKNNLEKRCRKW